MFEFDPHYSTPALLSFDCSWPTFNDQIILWHFCLLFCTHTHVMQMKLFIDFFKDNHYVEEKSIYMKFTTAVCELFSLRSCFVLTYSPIRLWLIYLLTSWYVLSPFYWTFYFNCDHTYMSQIAKEVNKCWNSWRKKVIFCVCILTVLYARYSARSR